MPDDTFRERAAPYALYPLRIGLAVVFVGYGWNKFADLAGAEALFEGWGIPLAGVSVVLVAIAELFGGLGILLGVLPRFSAAVLSVVMVTAMVAVKIPGPLQGGWALDAALLAGLLTIVVNGVGRPTVWSVLERTGLAPEHRLLERLRARTEEV